MHSFPPSLFFSAFLSLLIFERSVFTFCYYLIQTKELVDLCKSVLELETFKILPSNKAKETIAGAVHQTYFQIAQRYYDTVTALSSLRYRLVFTYSVDCFIFVTISFVVFVFFCQSNSLFFVSDSSLSFSLLLQKGD
jgi:hypothetical protein